MKKIDTLMQRLDHKVDRRILPFWRLFRRRFSIFSTTILLSLLAVFFYKVFHSKPQVVATAIIDDLKIIDTALNHIDKNCNILSIRGDRAIIDFLTVKKFVGSQVGALNLAYSTKWRGPYAQTNPAIQDKFYEIVKTKEGYFVVPGHGVQLPNGLFIGHDVEINFESSIKTMIKPGGRLNFHGNPLAFKLNFRIGDWDAQRLSDDKIEQISDMLKEFNQAMPFAKLEAALYPTINC